MNLHRTSIAIAPAFTLVISGSAPTPASTSSDADAAMSALVAAYWNPTTEYFYANSDHTIHPEHAYGPEGGLYTDFWWEAQMWETVMDAYERTGSPTYRTMLDDVYDGSLAYYPGFSNNVPGVQLTAGANTVSIIVDADKGSTNYLNLDHATLRYTIGS